MKMVMSSNHCTSIMNTSFLLLLVGAQLLLVSAGRCTCQPTEGYLVTRLWTIVDANMTDQDVIDEFNDGFAPVVTLMEGFQRYTAAKTGNASTVFFMNAFDTEEHAHEAQEAAKSFVEDGRLNGAITPNQFTEDVLVSYFNAEDCVTTDSTGLYMSTRLYNLPASMTLDAMAGSTSTVAVDMQAIDGFVSFASTLSTPNHIRAFFFNIYKTLEGAVASNNAGTSNVKNDPNNNVPDGVVLVEETAGQIAFDYICAIGLSDQFLAGNDSSAGQNFHFGSVVPVVVSAVITLLFALLGN